MKIYLISKLKGKKHIVTDNCNIKRFDLFPKSLFYFFVFILIAMIGNAFVDSIDHQKGASDLRYVWHIVKWFITFPSFVLAGISLFSFNLKEDLMFLIKKFKWYILLFFISIHVVWEVTYYLLRYAYKLYGIPWWF